MFFAQFWQWLTQRLTDYVSVHVAATAAAIEPAAVSLGAIYVMVWGFLHLKGAIQEPEGGLDLTLAAAFAGIRDKMAESGTVAGEAPVAEAPVADAPAVTPAAAPAEAAPTEEKASEGA